MGDDVDDLPALQQANLAIARQASTQAALGIADVVLRGISPEVLPKVLEKGQHIVNGLLDILKLNLSHLFYLALLIGAIQIWSIGFPYAAAHGAGIAILTIALPSAGLTLWSSSGTVSSASFGRSLARFVAPAAVSMAGAAYLVYVVILDRTGLIAYAQQAVSYTLIYAGLLLAVFVKPPWRFRDEDPSGIRKRDWRMTGLAFALGIAAFLLPGIPLLHQSYQLDWLRQPMDYGIVALAVVCWALVLGLVRRLIPPLEEQRPAKAVGRETRAVLQTLDAQPR